MDKDRKERIQNLQIKNRRKYGKSSKKIKNNKTNTQKKPLKKKKDYIHHLGNSKRLEVTKTRKNCAS